MRVVSKILSWLFVYSGLILITYGGLLLYLRTAPLPTIQEDVVSTANHFPSSITIPKLELSLPIYPASRVGNEWETSSVGVSYLTSSPLPGDQGNSVMYGHNWPNLLKRLKEVAPGDKIVVNRSGSPGLSYTIHFVSVVTPDQSHIYSNTNDQRLTLYTCTGFLDSKRLVVTAILDTSI